MGKMIDADGQPIQYSGCKNSGVHNQSECGVDYSATGVASLATPMYWPDLIVRENGSDNFWMKYVQDPSCKVKETGLYDALYDPDDQMLVKLNKYWDVGECGTPSA